jgi:hypothetical protein
MKGVALTLCIQMIPDSNLSMEFAILIEIPIIFLSLSKHIPQKS